MALPNARPWPDTLRFCHAMCLFSRACRTCQLEPGSLFEGCPQTAAERAAERVARLLGSPFQQTMKSLFHRVKLAAMQLYISYPPPWLYYISTCCAGVCLLVTRFNTAAVRILTSPVEDDSIKRPKQFAQVRIRKESTM